MIKQVTIVGIVLLVLSMLVTIDAIKFGLNDGPVAVEYRGPSMKKFMGPTTTTTPKPTPEELPPEPTEKPNMLMSGLNGLVSFLL